MKILVTGGAGFMGGNFIKYWLEKYPNDRIINYDSLTYSANEELLESFKTYKNYTFEYGSVAQPHKIMDACKGVDVIVNYAAETHVDRSVKDDSTFMYTNTIGTWFVLQAALENKVKKLIHISTDEVFGSLDLIGNGKFNDRSKYDPSSPYSASKASADHWVRAYHRTFGLPTIITTSSNNFGPYQFPEKFMPLVITNAIENKLIPIYGKGRNIRDWIYVEDHTRAVEKVIFDGKAGETYYISSNNEWANIRIAETILQRMGKSTSLLKFVKDRPGHDKRYALNNEKILAIGWEPVKGFEENLDFTIDWYKNNRGWWKKIKESDTFKTYYSAQYKGVV
jgi:dTDP-glucose 4,6-dehydratase